jgi:hypothetical protein
MLLICFANSILCFTVVPRKFELCYSVERFISYLYVMIVFSVLNKELCLKLVLRCFDDH